MKQKFIPNLLFGVAMSLMSVAILWLINQATGDFSSPIIFASAIMLGLALATHKVTERMGRH